MGALSSRHEHLTALLAQLSSYELVKQGETHGGIMGESPANTCLDLLTLAAQTIYNKGYLLVMPQWAYSLLLVSSALLIL